MHAELELPQELFNKNLGRRSQILAYPYGRWEEGLLPKVKEYGYIAAFSVRRQGNASFVRPLAAHRSQQEWLDVSQQMNEYMLTMERFASDPGRMSRRFKFAEGWRRHLHYGFCSEDADPLADALRQDYLNNKQYEASLESD